MTGVDIILNHRDTYCAVMEEDNKTNLDARQEANKGLIADLQSLLNDKEMTAEEKYHHLKQVAAFLL